MKPAYYLFLFFSFLFLAVITGTPYLASLGYDGAGEAGFASFSNACHQRPERSFFAWGMQLPVCARCFGIYLGMFLGTLAYPRASKGGMPPGWVILACAAPMVADGGSEFFGLQAGFNAVRAFTGVLFGAVIPYYLIPAADEALSHAKVVYMRFRR
jgi:uncharacterized membrane protein